MAARARVHADQQALHRDVARREEGPDHGPCDPSLETRLFAEDRLDHLLRLRDEPVVVLGSDERDLAALVGGRVLGEDLHGAEGRELGRLHHRPGGDRLPGVAQDHDGDPEDEGGRGHELPLPGDELPVLPTSGGGIALKG